MLSLFTFNDFSADVKMQRDTFAIKHYAGKVTYSVAGYVHTSWALHSLSGADPTMHPINTPPLHINSLLPHP